MSKCAVLVDYENIRISIGKKIGKHLNDIDFLQRLKEYIEDEISPIQHMMIYDNFEESYLVEANYLRRLTAYNMEPKYILQSGSIKNSADIELALDALQLYYEEHIHTFVIVSSDKDMYPLVRKLGQKGADVILIGQTFNASNHVINCASKFIPIEEVIDINYDRDFMIKKDLIVMVKRMNDLCEWATRKHGDMSKTMLLEKLRADVFNTKEYIAELYEEVITQKLFEEYTYEYKGAEYVGVRVVKANIVKQIVNDKLIPTMIHKHVRNKKRKI